MLHKKILVTGIAGFIGFHLSRQLLNLGYEVIGIDNLNDYYSVNLKKDRLYQLGVNRLKINSHDKIPSIKYNNLYFIYGDISNYDFVLDLMTNEKFDCVINLAAQAGVRYSLENPRLYLKSNVDGFLNILEGSRISDVKHLLYASSSSVYGLNSKMPLEESMPTEHPVSLYAATKKANEMMAHSYSNLYQLPTTGLRFFTVYGPWGRPDMALFMFVESIVKNTEIKLFNNGEMIRDFTYIDDIVEGIIRLIPFPPVKNFEWDSSLAESSTSSSPFQIFNLGNSSPVQLLDFISVIEKKLNKKANVTFHSMQKGDVVATYASNEKLEKKIGFRPCTKIEDGISNFVDWYLSYYK